MNINKQVIKNYLAIDLKKDLRTAKAILLRSRINGYIGWAGHGNLGDEAPYHAYKKLFPESRLVEFNLDRPIKVLSSLSRVEKSFGHVALGGGTLINQSEVYLKQTEYLIQRQVPMFCLGTGVASQSFWSSHQEIHTAGEITRWAELLKKFIYVGVRGPRSQKALAEVGLTVDVVGDSALTLADRTYRKRESKKIIGINVSRGTDNVMWGDFKMFINQVEAAVTQLVRVGFEVRILPIWQSDLGACEELENAVHDPACTIVTAYDTVEEYLRELDKCDLFIGQKLHATIFATMLRIPSIMLEYRPKCLDYMESINMENYSIRTDRVTAPLLIERLHELIKNYDSIVRTLDERILFYKDLQKEKANYILQKLGGHGAIA